MTRQLLAGFLLRPRDLSEEVEAKGVQMKPVRGRKQQQDRLLKRLNPRERRRQEQLRLLILQDQQFKII